MVIFWSLWFVRENTDERIPIRNSLTALLLCTVPIIAITRVIANFAPFSLRPIHTPNLEIVLLGEEVVKALDGWSSMPSDHASLFFGMAVAYFTINRTVGIFLIAWAVLISSLPRVVIGYHWPSDVFAGWLLGGAIALLLIRPLTQLVERSGIVSYFEARPAFGYPILFVATYEVVEMFKVTRLLVEKLAT